MPRKVDGLDRKDGGTSIHHGLYRATMTVRGLDERIAEGLVTAL